MEKVTTPAMVSAPARTTAVVATSSANPVVTTTVTATPKPMVSFAGAFPKALTATTAAGLTKTTSVTVTPKPGGAQTLTGTAGPTTIRLPNTSTTKILKVSGGATPQAGLKISQGLMFNITTSANGKNGVIPIILSPSSSSKVATSLAAQQAAEASKKRARMEGPTGALNGLDGSAGLAKVKIEIPALGDSTNGEHSHPQKRRRRTTEDGVKGLRYFATKVCDKVREKNLTTYNSVAEDLVQEYSEPNPSKSREEIACEQKNIRRRVYDALNVLMAINVIQKERKQIRWVGLPRTLSEAGVLKRDSLAERKKSLSYQRQRLFHSALQLIALKELVEDNKSRQATVCRSGADDTCSVSQEPSSSCSSQTMDTSSTSLMSDTETDETQHIHMPFLFLTSGNRCEVECSVAPDSQEFELQFSEPFKIIEDTEVLRHIPLVKALDRDKFSMEHVQKAIQQLPSFMQLRFINLLTEHQERLKKMTDGKRQEEMARAAAALEEHRQQQQQQAMEHALAANTPIAPAPPRKDEEPDESVVDPAVHHGVSLHPVVSAAPIAALHTGSPVTLKPGYYIQISNMGVAHMTPVSSGTR